MAVIYKIFKLKPSKVSFNKILVKLQLNYIYLPKKPTKSIYSAYFNILTYINYNNF